MSKTIGIIGGMGPAASCDLYESIIDNTYANSDQEHLHVIIDSNSNIGDRTNYIIAQIKAAKNQSALPTLEQDILKNYDDDFAVDYNPLDEIKKSAEMLIDDGAQIIIMPCNTSHYFYDELKMFLGDKFLGITDACLEYLKTNDINKVVVLATNGTVCAGVYDKFFNANGIDCAYPSINDQNLLMKIIYDCVKANKLHLLENYRIQIENMIDSFCKDGYKNIILACTELPIAFKYLKLGGANFINTNLELARAAIKLAQD